MTEWRFNSFVNFPNSGITELGGIFVKMLNQTGFPTIKGTVLSIGSIPNSVSVCIGSEEKAIAIAYDSGVTNGAMCKAVICGIADVLLEDGKGCVAGYCAELSKAQNGRVDGSASVNKDCGYMLESKTAGTNVLAKMLIHFDFKK